MSEILQNINEAERGGNTDLGKALRKILGLEGEGGETTLSAILEALSSLDATQGILYQSGATTFLKYPIGTAPATIAAGDHNHTGIYLNILSPSTTGNFPLIAANGELENSAFSPAYFATVSHVHSQLHAPVTLAGASNYLTITAQEISQAPINLTSHITGNLPVVHLNSGTNASGTTFLRGDMVWAAPVSGLLESTQAQVRSGESGVAVSPAVLFSSQAQVVLTDAATVAIDYNAGLVFKLTLGGNRTMGQPINAKVGQCGEFWIYQDGTGGRTLAWHADFKFDGPAPVIPIAVGARCIVAYRVTGANEIQCTPAIASVHDAVTLAGTPDYLTLSNQVITRGLVDLATDVTGNLPVTNLNSGTSASVSTFFRGDGTWAEPPGGGVGITMEDAQDAVGTILTDSASIDFTYNDVGNTITATVIFGSTSTTAAAGNHNHDAAYISVIGTPTTGSFPTITAGGELITSAFSSASFATAAQGTLADSATQPGDNISTLTNDSAFVTSAHNHDSTYISIVTTPTTGNFPVLTAGGELNNSTFSDASFATAGHTHGQLHDAVTLAGTPDYITITGQVITRNAVDLAADVSGNLPVTNLGSGTNASATTFWRGDGTWVTPTNTVYTNEEAQDAVGTILTDSASIDFTYNDAGNTITAVAIFGTTATTVAAGNHTHAALYQPLDAELTALAGLSSAVDTLPYFTGIGSAGVTTFTTFGRSLIDDAAASNARTTLELGTIATQASSNVTITGGSVTGITDLAIADGGTGSSTAAAAFAALKQAASETVSGVVELATSAEVTAGLAIQASDTRLSDARAPTAHNHDANYISIVTTPTTGNFPVLTAGGELNNSTYSNASFATAAQGILADSATQPGDNVSTLTNDSSFIASSRSVLTTHSLAGGGNLTADRTLALLNDVATPGINKVYGTDGAGARGWKDDPAGTGGSSSFTGLTDTPTNYTAAGGFTVKVNSGATALEFVNVSGTYTDEQAQDAVGAILVDSASINFTYTDATPEITAVAIFGTSAGTVAEGSHSHAQLHDAVTLGGTLDYITLAGQVLTRNAVDLAADVSGNLPVGNLGSGTGASATTFWRGDGTWVTPTDTNTVYTDEQAQDAVGTILVDSASINFTYTDATPAITAVAIFGATADTVCVGNDARLSDARVPLSHDHDASYISLVATPTTGNFAVLTAGGELNNSIYGPTDFATDDHTHGQLHDAVTLAGTPDYITLAGQVLTRNAVDLAADVSGNLPVGNLGSGTSASTTTFWRGDGSWATPSGTGGYTDEEAQDSVGLILTDSASINFTYNDVTPTITAVAIFGSTTGTVAEGNDARFHDSVTLAGTPDYITLAGQVLTRGLVDVATDITGNLPVGNLGSGTSASATTFWRGDGSWATPAGGGLSEATATQVRDGTAAVAISPSVYYSAYAPVTLTDGANIAVDMNSGLVFKVTLAGNRTIDNPTNEKVGQAGEFWIFQDATGGRTLAWGNEYTFLGGPPVQPTAANAICVVAYRVMAGGEIRCSANTGLQVNLATGVTGTLPIASGGTGATTASAAFTALKQAASETATGVVELATSAETTAGLAVQASDTRLHDAITLAGAPDYLTLAGQVLTRNAVDLAADVSGNLPVGNLGSGTLASTTTFWRGDGSWAEPTGVGGYTNEEAQDAVGTILADSTSINFTYTDATPEITAVAIFGSTTGTVAQGDDTRFHNAVTLAGTPDYITLSGQVITRNAVDLAADVAGNLPVGNLGSGTSASATTYWRGDGTWATPGGGGLSEATAIQVRDGTAAVAISPAVYYSAYAPVTLTDGANISVDMNAGLVFKVTLAGNRIIDNPINEKVGQNGEFWIFQDATGNRTLAWGTEYTFVGGTPVQPTTANAVCVVAYRVMATGEIRCSASTGGDFGTMSAQDANNVTITGGLITGITDLAITEGGTGQSTAAAAFTALKQVATETTTGVVELATSAETTAGLAVQASDTRLHAAVTLAGTPDYLTLAGQVLTRNAIDLTTDTTGALAIASGGSGQTTAAAAFTAFKQNATDTATGVVELATAAEVVTGTDTTRAVTAASVFARYQPLRSVVTESGTTHTNAASDRDKWIRFTGTAAKTFTISSGVAATGDIWAFNNVGATGNLSVAASGTTLTGNLVFAPLKGGFLFFTSSSAADVIGGSAT